MKTLTVAKIRKFDPCCDPTDYVAENWRGTVPDVLRMRKVPPNHKIWLATRNGALQVKTQRLFAVACARRALKHDKSPDPRSIVSCDMAERFALGRATKKQLIAAREAAFSARNERRGVYAAYAAANAAYAAAAADATDSANAAYAAANAAAADATDSANAAYAERRWQLRTLVKLIKEHETG